MLKAIAFEAALGFGLLLPYAHECIADSTANMPADDVSALVLDTIDVTTTRLQSPRPGNAQTLMPPAPGNQTASGNRLGILGNRATLDTPFNLTGYTAQYVADSQSRSIADVAATDPSVRVIFPRASYRDVYSIRGFNLFSYNMGFDGLYGIAPKQRYPAEFAERIEILKGPDTFLNGLSLGGSVGGAINIVPKRAADAPVTRVTTQMESNADLSAHVDVGRRFGENDAWGLRVNGLNRGGDQRVDDQSERSAAMATSLDYQGDQSRWYLDFGRQRQRLNAPNWAVTLAPRVSSPPKVNNRTDLGQSWGRLRTTDRYAAVRAESDLNEQWTAFLALGTSKTETTGVYIQPTALQANGDYHAAINSFPSNGEHVSGQTGLHGSFSTGSVDHQVTLAAVYWMQNLKAAFTSLGGYPSNTHDPQPARQPDTTMVPDLDHLHRTSQTRYGSLLIADTLGIAGDRLQLTLGVRLQGIRSANFAAQTGAGTAHYNQSAVSPAYAALYKITENVSLYANFVEALQQGPTAPAGSFNAGEAFAPVVARQGEVGVKAQWSAGFTSLSVFQITQPYGITDIETGLYSVNGRQRNRGLEWNISGQPLKRWRVLGGIMWLDARQIKSATDQGDNHKAIGAPDYQANASLEYDTGLTDLTLTARAIRTAKQYIDAANTQQIPAWTRYDLGLRYALKGFTAEPVMVRASVENAFDTNYWASAASGQAAGISRGAPRTLLLASTFSF